MKKESNKKLAFTLAEVLITLGIIGIVSALTIPTLVKNYQEKVTVTKLKKMYATLSNAYQLYKIDNPTPPVFPITEEGAIKAFEIFKPHLKIAKDCGTKDGTGCVGNGKYNYLNKQISTTNYLSDKSYYKILLSDGASLIIRGGYGTTIPLFIFYDVNGPEAPNTWGQDLFEFQLNSNRIIPSGNSTTFNTSCAKSTSNGDHCAAWVIYKGNLDYLKCPDKLTWQDSKCPE